MTEPTPEDEEWQYLARFHLTELVVDDPYFPTRCSVQCRCGWKSPWHDSSFDAPEILLAEARMHLPRMEPP